MKTFVEQNVVLNLILKPSHELYAILLDGRYLIFLQSPNSRKGASIMSSKLLSVMDTLLLPGFLII